MQTSDTLPERFHKTRGALKEVILKLTKKIERLIDRRTKLAMELNEVGSQVNDFITEHNMENEVEDFDWMTGCEIYGNPSASGERIKEAIRKH